MACLRSNFNLGKERFRACIIKIQDTVLTYIHRAFITFLPSRVGHLIYPEYSSCSGHWLLVPSYAFFVGRSGTEEGLFFYLLRVFPANHRSTIFPYLSWFPDVSNQRIFTSSVLNFGGSFLTRHLAVCRARKLFLLCMGKISNGYILSGKLNWEIEDLFI